MLEYIFSFKDLLSPGQATNQRWVEIAETVDQLFEEFVYPELERTKNLKSIYTADEEDLDNINIDKYYYLFENIQESAKTKRIALWMQSEIIKAKNKDDSILLAIASLGYPRDSVRILAYYAPKAGEYKKENLRSFNAVDDMSNYYLTSRIGVSIDRNAIHAAGMDPAEAEQNIADVLSENILPEHIDLLPTFHAESDGFEKILGYVSLSPKIFIETVTI